jgi:hypothetical protein
LLFNRNGSKCCGSTIAADIAGNAPEFVEWGTKRVDWHNRDVTIGGDQDYGCRFLDWVNIV